MLPRTMVYLESEQIDELRRISARERTSVTELIRRAVRDFLGAKPAGPVSPDVYRRIVGLGDSGRSDVAENHDKYLAGALSRKLE